MSDAASHAHADRRKRGVARRGWSSSEGPLRLNVFATDVAEVVEAAGGWLFDRARNGWTVTVFIADGDDDPTPLSILGVRARRGLQRLPTIAPEDVRPHAIAASTHVIRGDEGARTDVAAALERATSRVVLWGDPVPSMGHRFGSYVHHLSPAALAFKAHALRAVRRDGYEDSSTEGFRGRIKNAGPCDSDLVSVLSSSRRLRCSGARHR